MSIDPYALCPCGSGKKLKFCCSDSIADIERIHRMIEGDQPRAALRHAEEALAKHPGRASLLDLKATLEISLDELSAARETVDEFISKHDDSPTAHACRALLLTQSDDPADIRAAAEEIQQGLSLVEYNLPERLYEAIGAVGSALLMAGNIISAQAHLWMHAAVASPDDARARELLVQLNHYSGLPVLLRDRLRFLPWPEDVSWKADADEATRLANRGRWREAVVILDRLGQEYGAHPTLVYNRALVGGWLADERTLAAGLHAYAQLETPLDDAIEAEAIAQLLDPDCKETEVESVVRVHEVNDLDELITRLASDRRIVSFQLDPAADTEGRPRPRHTYLMLDRPRPATGVGLTRNELPRLLGALAVFGRQTDRRERLEFTADKDADYESTVQTLESIAGDAMGPLSKEEVVDRVSPTTLALNRRLYFPDDTPPDVRRTLAAEERKASIVELWPDIARPALRGKSPREAKDDPELRIPLLAAVMILEQAQTSALHDETFDGLRAKLGLPAVEAIHLTEGQGKTLPIVRVPRVDVSRISDDDLTNLYRRAMLAGVGPAIVHLAREVVRRPSVFDRIPPREAYSRLLAAERDSGKARKLLAEARSTSVAADDHKIWDLLELELFVTSGNGPEATAAIGRIQQKYAGDAEMDTALYQLLYRLGAFREEDAWEDDENAGELAAVSAGAGDAPSSGGRIWTPDSERPAGGKSTLWTPS